MNQPNFKRGLRILLVENHEDTRKYLALYLEGLGHRVATTATVAGALAALHDDEPDVLISDIGLPDGDGWELLRRANFHHPVYAIATSGYGMDVDRERSRKVGFRHHLLKPLAVDELNRALAEAEQEHPQLAHD